MAGENPLVEAPPAESSSFFNAGTGDNGWATGVSIAESAMDTFNGIKDGNWVEAGLGMVGLAADAAAMAIDPFGTLMSSAASFLMEHVQPLKDMLDWLAGNPPVIESYSTTWNNVAEELGKIAEEYTAGVQRGTEGWTGSAAETYQTNSKVHGDALTGAASAAGTVGTVVGLMGMVVGFVREMVRDLIADLVGKLIAWVLEAVFSLGFGTPVIVAQAVTAISKWAAKIAKIIQDLLNTIKKVSPMLKRLVEVFEKIMKVVGKLAGKVTGLDVLDPKNIKKGGFLQTGNTDIDTPSGSPDTSPSGTGRDGGTGNTDSGDTSTSDTGNPSNRPSDSTSTSSTSTTTDPTTSSSRPGRGDPTDVPTPTSRPGNNPNAPDNDLPRGNVPGPGNPPPGRTPIGEHRGGPGGNTPIGEHRGGPGGNSPAGNSPIGEHRGGPGGQPAPGGYTGGGSPSPNGGPGGGGYPNGGGSPSGGPGGGGSPSGGGNPGGGGSPNGGGPGGGGSPSSGGPSGGGSPNGGGSPSGGGAPNSAPPPRFDQTSAANAATPEAPSRPDHSTTGAPNNPGSTTPGPQGTQPGPGYAPPAGAPGGGAPGGGAPGGGSPGGGGARPGGGGWTGTPGGRGDLGSGIPPARSPEHVGPSSHGPSSTSPSNTSPSSHGPSGTSPSGTSPSNTGPSHAGPNTPHTGPSGTGPSHTGPGNTGPSHARPQGGPTPPHAGPPQGGSPYGGPPHGGSPHAGPSHTNPSQAGPPHSNAPRPNGPHNGPAHPYSPNAPHTPNGPNSPNGPSHTSPSQHTPNNGPPNRGPAGAPHQRDGSPDFTRPRGGDGPVPHTPNRPFDGPPPQRHPDAQAPTPRRDPDTQLPPRRDPDGIPNQRRDPDAWAPPHRDPDTPNTDKPDTHKPDADQPHTDRSDSDSPNSDSASSDRADAEQPSIDEAHARHGEATPAGISHHRGDSDMGDLPHRVPPDPRYFTADVHVTPDGRARIGNHTYSPEEYGDLLRRNGWDGNTPIRLIGCDAGSNDFANRLSHHTGADVLAPTKPAWTDTNGRVYTSDADIGPDGNRQPRIPPNGEWQTHRPDGTTTKTGDDGYVPGTKDTDKADHTTPDDARDRAARPGQRELPTHRDIDWQEPSYRHTAPDVPLRNDEPFYNPPAFDRRLEPDTRYRVLDENGDLRSTIYTNNEQPPRITHVDAHTPDTRIGTPQNPMGNPDSYHLRPDVQYQVHTGGDPFTFRTDADGRPTFDLDDPQTPSGPQYEQGGSNYRREVLTGDPSQAPFSDRRDLLPDHRYEVHLRGPDGQESWYGDFYTSPEMRDGQSQFTHARVLDGSPELGNRHTMRDPASLEQFDAPRNRTEPDPATGERPLGLPLAETRFTVGTTQYHTDAYGNSSISYTPDFSSSGRLGRDNMVQTPIGHHGNAVYPGTEHRGGHLRPHAEGGDHTAANAVSQQWRENNVRRPENDPQSRYKDSWAQMEKDRAAANAAGEGVAKVRIFSGPSSQGRVPDRLYIVEERHDPSTGRTSFHFRSSPNV